MEVGLKKFQLFLLSLVFISASVTAADGRYEINQTCAEQTGCFPGDSPGFPITIEGSGSYIFTGSLYNQDPNTNVIDSASES
jgi:hypothetical protein